MLAWLTTDQTAFSDLKHKPSVIYFSPLPHRSVDWTKYSTCFWCLDCLTNVSHSDLICDLKRLQTSRQSDVKAPFCLRDVKGFSWLVHAVKTSLPSRTDQRVVSCGAGSDKCSKFDCGGNKNQWRNYCNWIKRWWNQHYPISHKFHVFSTSVCVLLFRNIFVQSVIGCALHENWPSVVVFRKVKHNLRLDCIVFQLFYGWLCGEVIE